MAPQDPGKDAGKDPGRPSSPLLVGPVVVLAALLVALFLWHDLLIGASIADFLVVTLFLGGGAAWLTGRAVARSWAPYSELLVYCVLLAGAVRFCHFALFDDQLVSPEPAAVEFVLLAAVATLGFRAHRRRQMTVQYAWMYEPAGHFAWRGRDGGGS